MIAAEYVKDADDTAIECVCLNTADSDGFNMCLPDGALVGPGVDDTPSEHILCFSCRRIILSATGLVTGRVGPEGELACLHEDVWPARDGKPAWCQTCGRDQ